MSQRYALIIGNSQYDDDTLKKLRAPEIDVLSLANALKNVDVGSFDKVDTLIDMNWAEVQSTLADFFAEKQPEDLLLVYFSGHGVLDDHGRLYLAMKDSRRNRLSGSAISSRFITDEMDNSRSRKQILILDCCHSGAFSRGTKGVTGSTAVNSSTFEGEGQGRVVLTATDATQYAWEGNQIIGEAENSLFTHFLLEGLLTGNADIDNNGQITLNELYQYTFSRISSTTNKQRPKMWAYSQEGGQLVIGKSQNPKRQELRAVENLLEKWSNIGFESLSLIEKVSLLEKASQIEAASQLLYDALRDQSPRVYGLAIDTIKNKFSKSKKKLLANYTPAGMVRIPAGKFLSGEGTDEIQEQTQEYFIDKYPVTNLDYYLFVKDTLRSAPHYWRNGEIPNGYEHHPVVFISWFDAMDYAAWVFKRLPTENEWEKAASWDANRRRKLRYPWGDEWNQNYCNSEETGVGDTKPIGFYSPQGDSKFGVAETMGNIREWTSTSYSLSNKDGSESVQVVIRGKSWNRLTTWGRVLMKPEPAPMPNSFYRFRCAISLE